jgi:glucose/arabinose dehydrogenase
MTGVAISPIDGRLFLTYNDLNKDTNIVSYDFNNGVPDPSTRRLILFVKQPGLGHKAGNLIFDESGALYISLGDGGGNKGATSQDYTSLLGSILKIIPNIDSDGYTVPADNPFVDDPTRAPEIYVKGLRQPHRFALNHANGDIYIGDVGESDYEELNFLPAGTSGVNLGWPYMEGLEQRKNGGAYEFTPPIYQFAHPSWIAIITGFVYHGEKIPKMKGALIFGDMAGKMCLLGSDGVTVLNISESGNILTSFAEGPDGELYSLSRSGGVKRIDPA